MFVLQMLSLGCTTYSFGLFVKPIVAAFGVSRATANLGLMLILTGTAVASPFVGRALDRRPARQIVLFGAACFLVGTSAIAASPRLPAMAIALVGPLAIGVVALGPLTASFLVTRWFDDLVTRALALSAIAASAGGAVVVPIMSALVAGLGWRSAVFAAGAGTAAIATAVALFVIRDRPPAVVARPDGAGPASTWSVARLLRTRDFWLLVFAAGSLLAINGALVALLVAYGTDRGFSLGQATALVSAVSFSSIAGKLTLSAVGGICDNRWLLAGSSAMMGAFLAILAAHPPFAVLIAGCLASGVATGISLPVWGALIYARFGTGSYGLVMGLMLQIQLPLMLGALRFTGASYDATGSYDQSFRYFLAVIPFVIAACLMIGRPHYRRM